MNLTNAKGFTLFEMILTVAIMAILVATTTPSIYEFIRQRDKQNEEVAQMQVRKALEAYIAEKGVPPSDSSTTDPWYEELAGYTSLSANEIANDVWGRPRMYVAYLDTSRIVYGTTVSVTYATLHSMGENGEAQNSEVVNGVSTSVAGIAVANKAFSGSTAPGWWKNKAITSRIDVFAQLRAVGDDQMMRYTNYEDVLRRYNATRERLDKLSEAMETYARSQYANHVSICAGATPPATVCNTTDKTPLSAIYYPRSQPKVNVPADSGRYVQNGALSTNIVVDNSEDDETRREHMENLMGILGLPLEYCCSALNNASDKKPAPFFYFTNPRPRSGTGCGPRPGINAPKLPARITTTYTSSTCD